MQHGLQQQLKREILVKRNKQQQCKQIIYVSTQIVVVNFFYFSIVVEAHTVFLSYTKYNQNNTIVLYTTFTKLVLRAGGMKITHSNYFTFKCHQLINA